VRDRGAGTLAAAAGRGPAQPALVGPRDPTADGRAAGAAMHDVLPKKHKRNRDRASTGGGMILPFF